MRPAQLNHYLASFEGIALARHWLIGDRDEAVRRFEELARLVQGAGEHPGLEFTAESVPPSEGYARWAATYDRFPNPLIAAEQDPVRALIDELPLGDALDAACGSGRHTGYLLERGHRVIGVDVSAEMLARAAQTASAAELRTGRLDELPVDSASIDLALCALALTHCAKLAAPISELARVLRPGGRLLLSDLHPFMGLLGNTALFLDAEGRPGIVESFAHLHSDYVEAFAAAGLTIERCVEPRYTPEHLPALTAAMPPSSHAAIAAAIVGLPAALIWVVRRL